jgi:hypothetical protein
MYKPTKKYLLWINYGCEGWGFYEYDTIEECLTHENYGNDFIITKAVDWEVKEK